MDGYKLSAFHRGLLITGKRDPGTFCIGVGGPYSVPGCVGKDRFHPRTGHEGPAGE
jgi:hypothetical protein